MKILVVEDDRAISEAIQHGLMADSHTVEVAEDGQEGSFLARSYIYDAIVLDYSLPKKSGLLLCKEIRASGRSMPILFLSVTSDAETKVNALNEGADDYMTKPFSMSELRARIKALGRRPVNTKQSSIITIDDLSLDTDKQSVHRGSKKIHLTRKEFAVLEYMMRNQGTILSRPLIMEHVWTAESDPLSNTVEVHVRNIRRKISTGKKSELISNIPGRGYIIDVPRPS